MKIEEAIWFERLAILMVEAILVGVADIVINRVDSVQEHVRKFRELVGNR